MASKRKTKAQREQEQKGALLQRLCDIYSGADGCSIDADDAVFPETLSKVIPVVKAAFGEPHSGSFGWCAHMLDEWQTPKQACELLFRHGFRADSKWEETSEEDSNA